MGPDKPKRNRSAWSKQYYAKNKERSNAKSKAWRDKNKERLRAYAAKYRAENKEKIAKTQKLYVQRRKEELREIARARYVNNRDEILARDKESRQRRAEKIRRRQLSPRGRYTALKVRGKRRCGITLTFEEYATLCDRPCTYCEVSIVSGGGLDRIDNDKGYALDNVVPCCGRCNRTRGDNFTYEEMRDFLAPAIRQVLAARAAAKS